MTQVGLLPSQELASLYQNEAGDWLDVPEKQTVIPLVKLGKPADTQGSTWKPQLKWFGDRVERGWVKAPLPPETEVTSITKLQRNLWLATKGLYNQATTWINKPDEQTLIRQIYWRDAETTKIDDPITIALAEELGLKTREQRVAAFREASKIG